MADYETNATVVAKRMMSPSEAGYEIEIREALSRRRIVVTMTAEQFAGAMTALVSECRVRIIDRKEKP